MAGFISALVKQRNDAKKAEPSKNERLKEIIGVIRMTINAEAFRSLRRFPSCAARAEECRREALRFLRSGDPAAETKSFWRAWLDNPDAVPSPGLSYWY